MGITGFFRVQPTKSAGTISSFEIMSGQHRHQIHDAPKGCSIAKHSSFCPPGRLVWLYILKTLRLSGCGCDNTSMPSSKMTKMGGLVAEELGKAPVAHAVGNALRLSGKFLCNISLYEYIGAKPCQALSMIKTVTVISSSSCTRSLELQKRSIKSVSLYPRVLKKKLAIDLLPEISQCKIEEPCCINSTWVKHGSFCQNKH